MISKLSWLSVIGVFIGLESENFPFFWLYEMSSGALGSWQRFWAFEEEFDLTTFSFVFPFCSRRSSSSDPSAFQWSVLLVLGRLLLPDGSSSESDSNVRPHSLVLWIAVQSRPFFFSGCRASLQVLLAPRQGGCGWTWLKFCSGVETGGTQPAPCIWGCCWKLECAGPLVPQKGRFSVKSQYWLNSTTFFNSTDY